MDASGGGGGSSNASPAAAKKEAGGVSETPRIAYVYSVPLIHRIGR